MHPLVNTYKNIHMHTNMYPPTQANTKLNTHIISLSLFRALLWYLNAHWHCSVLLFACTGLNTHVSWRKKKEDTKLKHATKSWNWPYQIGPTINQFLYLHYSILSILCAFSLTLLTFFFYFPPTTALHKHEKGSCSAISAIQASRDQGFNHKTISGLKKKRKKKKKGL